METTAFLAQIRQQIEHNDLKGALKQLKRLLKNSPHLNEVLQQSARHRDLSKKIRTGKIDFADATLTQNQITKGLLDLISEIKEQAQSPEIESEVQQLIQKNIVKKSKLKAKRDISIGDSTIHNHFHAYPNGRQLPKVLSQNNPLYPQYFIGREDEMDEIHLRLSEPGKFLLLVNGKGGIGKTSLAARYYHHYQQDYQHLAWVLKEPGKSIVDALLTLELKLGLKADRQTPAQRLQVLISELTNLKGPSLLVIDNADDMEDLEQHHGVLGGLAQLRIIFTTRVTELTDLPILLIEGLNETNALKLFSRYFRALDEAEQAMVLSIRQAVNANTLVLEILAKNLFELNRLGNYSLQQLLSALQGKGLLAVPGKKVSTPYQQFNKAMPEEIITAIYDLSPLSENEQNWLAIFAALPAENIPYEHLCLLLAYAEEQEDSLLSLAQKGWLDFAQETKSFKVSPVIQTVVKYKHKGMDEVLLPLVHGLKNNLHRDQLHHDNYALSTILVGYGESVITSLSDPIEFDVTRLFRNIGNFYSETGDIYAAQEAYQQTQTIQVALCEAEPGNPDYKNSLAISYQYLGITQSALGDLEAALGYYEQYNQLEQALHTAFPQNVSYKNLLAISYQYLGITQSALGDLEAALGYYEQYNQLEQELHTTFPQNVSYKNLLAISYQYLGITQSALDNLESALGYYEQFHQLEQELHTAFPQNVSYKNALAISNQYLGNTHRSLGNLEAALGHYEQYNQLEQELHTAFPQKVSYKNFLAISYQYLGITQSALGNLASVLGYYEQFHQLEQELHTTFPQNVSYKNALAVSYQKLGNTHSALGNLESALGYYEQFHQLEQELHTVFPQNVEFKNLLAISYAKLGEFYRDQEEDPAKARPYFQQAESLWLELVRDAPQYAEFQERLIWVQEALAKLDS